MTTASSHHNPVDLDPYRTALTIEETCQRLGLEINGNGKISCFKRSEKTPSMEVYRDHLYCFGCGARVDNIGLVRHMQNCDFMSAVNWIADQVGLPRPQRDPEAQKRYEAVQSITNTFSQVFHDSRKDPGPALAYLDRRGISRKTTTGHVGYLPANYKPSDLEAAKRAGLISQKGNFLFAGRLVIPITHHGQIVSLYGRAVKDCAPEHRHRYPGTTDPPMPATPWNLDACRGLKEVQLAECIIDGLTLVDRDFNNTIGLFGTQGLTDARLAALKKTSIEKITLCFDSDSSRAGQTAALKTGEKLFRAGYDVEILTLPLQPEQDKVDVNLYFQNHPTEDFNQLAGRLFIDCLLDTVPMSGSIIKRYKELKPIFKLISEQPELLWKEYISILSARFPALDKRKIEREISQYRKDAEENREASKRFLPLAYVEKIQEQAPVICFDGRHYRYQGGVYSPWYSEEVDQATIGLIGPKTQGSHLDSVRKFLNSVCFVRPEKVNPRGLLNLRNGILDLSSGSLIKHSPDYLFTVQSKTASDPKAECPLWLQTIAEILPASELRVLLAQVFGYCLTPDNSQQTGFIFYGDGRNGKSLITDVLEALAGRDNCSALHLSDFKERFRLAELQNKLINFSSEVEAKGLVNDARLKGTITGDPLTAERKNQPPFVFRPFVKLVVSCNNLPQTKDKSTGYFRRWIIIPFQQKFERQNRDSRRARTIIETELSGVLNWAIGGYKSLIEAGYFIEPSASVEALNEYRRQTDPTMDFVEEECRILKAEKQGLSLKEAYKKYEEWASQTNVERLGRNNFGKAISRITGLPLTKGEGGKFFPGLFFA